jgi:hypothetical protein
MASFNGSSRATRFVFRLPFATGKHASINRRRRRIVWGVLAVCFLAYIPAMAGLISGAWPFEDDALGLFRPWREFARQALANGTVPLWNPHTFCGLPFMSNGQTAVLYPPNLVYWIFPTPSALLLDALGHNLLLAFGTYALARALGLSHTASWVATVAAALGAAVSAHIYTGHMTWHAARAYVPWELWAMLLYLRTGWRRYAFALTGLLTLQIFSGYPPMVLLGIGLCVGLLVARAVSYAVPQNRVLSRQPSGERNCGRGLPRGWLQMASLVGVLVMLLTAVSVLPLRETSRLSIHGAGLTYEHAVALSGSWRSIFRLIAPEFFGGNRSRQWSLQYGAHEEAAYIGVLPLVLAVGAPLFARQRDSATPRAVPWLSALLPLSLLLAMGDNTPLYRWLFEYFTPLRLTRFPVRWLEVWALAAALLAGFSFDGIVHRAKHRAGTAGHTAWRARVLQITLCVLSVSFLSLMVAMYRIPLDAPLWMQTAQWNAPFRTPSEQLIVAAHLRWMAVLASFKTCAIAAICAGLWLCCQRTTRPQWRKWVEWLLVAAITLDVLIVFWMSATLVSPRKLHEEIVWPVSLAQRYEPAQRWDTFVRWTTINGGMPLGVDIFNGYDTMNSRRYFEFVNAVEGQEFWVDMYQPQSRSPLLRVVGVTHTLTSLPSAGPVQPRSSGMSLMAQQGRWKLWRHDLAWPRVYLSRLVVREPGDKQLHAPETSSAPTNQSWYHRMCLTKCGFRLSPHAIKSSVGHAVSTSPRFKQPRRSRQS